MFSEIIQQIKHMPFEKAVEFNDLLIKELNIDLSVLETLRLKEIKKVLKRGKISSDIEYYLLESIVNDTAKDSSSDIELINNLLAKYHLEKLK